MFFPDFINIENQIQTKEDKVLMLSGLFDKSKSHTRLFICE